jgi:tRNA nucleotidyltransferase/poly(A) polymerase
MGKLNKITQYYREKNFIKELINSGFEVYLVGGIVRDLILNNQNKDVDLVVRKASIDSLIQKLRKFGDVNLVGKSFGVLKFVDNDGIDYDIALPRKDIPTGEGGHRGFEIQSDENLSIEDELIRRDAKMNAMALNLNTGKFIDPLGGLDDIENKQISAANPEAFSDDALRMLRAIQFASCFGFTIEPKTMQMIIDNADKITEIAPERILIELDKIVNKGNPRIGIQLLVNTGLFKQIFGNEIKQSQIDDRDFNNVKTMGEFLFLMMNDVVQNPPEFYLSRFSTTDAKRDKIYKELRALDLAFNSDLANEQTDSVKARSLASNMYNIAPQTLENQILPETIRNAGQELLQGKYPKTVNELAVNGNDLMQQGLSGKAVGDMQKSMLIWIYADKIRNNKEELLSLVNKTNDMEEGYGNYSKPPDTWDINGEQVTIDFFVKEYDKWNNQHGKPVYENASKASVLEFLQNNYEDESADENLKRQLYWELTDRDLLKEDNDVKKISYSAVVLDDKSRKQLIKVFSQMIPEDWEIIADHMTIKMGGLEDGSQEKQDMEDGKEIHLNVVDYVMDDKVMAIGVKGYPLTNVKPHIIIVVNRTEGGKPFMSNKLTDWRKIGFSFELTGKIEEVS